MFDLLEFFKNAYHSLQFYGLRKLEVPAVNCFPQPINIVTDPFIISFMAQLTVLRDHYEAH